MITVVTLLWDANGKSQDFSRCYDESWVEKLHRGFRRNLTQRFRFLCLTDRERKFSPGIDQGKILTKEPHYGCYVEPFRLDEPMIIVGLDTVIVGNIDHMADYCLSGGALALPKSPYEDIACNAVALVPAGQKRVYDEWRGENDMEWLRKQPHVYIDGIFPDQVRSYKAHVRGRGLGAARICYFHGRPKMQDCGHEAFIQEHWI